MEHKATPEEIINKLCKMKCYYCGRYRYSDEMIKVTGREYCRSDNDTCYDIFKAKEDEKRKQWHKKRNTATSTI